MVSGMVATIVVGMVVVGIVAAGGGVEGKGWQPEFNHSLLCLVS